MCFCLTPVGDYMKAGTQSMTCPLLFLLIRVPYPYSVSLLEQLPGRFFSPSGALGDLRMRTTIGSPINQHFGLKHCCSKTQSTPSRLVQNISFENPGKIVLISSFVANRLLVERLQRCNPWIQLKQTLSPSGILHFKLL